MLNRVSVTVFGKAFDKNYTQLLHSKRDLDLKTVFLLDQARKRKTISKEDYRTLRKSGLVEGRYPALYVSYPSARSSMFGIQSRDLSICSQTTFRLTRGLHSMISLSWTCPTMKQWRKVYMA